MNASAHAHYGLSEHNSVSIPGIAGDLVAAGVLPDELADALPDAIDQQHSDWANAVFAGGEVPDLDRLALLVAAGTVDRADADHLLDGDAEGAVEEAKHRLRHPDPDDDPVQIRRDITRLEALRARRQRAWDDALAKADYVLDATVTYAAAAPAEPLARPTATLDDAIAAVEAAISDAIEGRGPKHVLINADRGTRKTRTAIRFVGDKAKKRRNIRRRWIEDYRRDHPGTSHADAADAADAAGMRYLRVLYVAEYHDLVGKGVTFAREMFMRSEHHGGLDRGFDPADPTSPPICTQPERVKQTRLAGESVPDKACGRTSGQPGCPDFSGCRKWQRLRNCAHAEFVGTTIDQAFAPFLPRELIGFDVVIIDEALDRVGYREADLSLDPLSDRHFDAHPVLGADGQPDLAANAVARAEYAIVRDIIDSKPNDYAPKEALRAKGFDRERWLRLIGLTNARDRPSGITSATPDDERATLARISFRRPIRALCTLFRALAEPGDGWVRLVDAGEHRRAIVRSVRTLHPSVLATQIIALDGSPDLTSWQRFIPDLEVVTAPRPRAPHETAVQIVRPNGKHAMRKPARKAYDQAIVALYAHGSTGVLTHKEHEADFIGPNIITGHHGGLAGRNDWRDCSTMIGFGLPFLSPEGAAYEGAGRTGEVVAPAMPVRALLPQMMKSGGVTLVPSMEYQHPAAREAQAAVRDRAAMQGIGGRPRASSRTADNPVLSLQIGHGVISGMEFDCVITSAEQFAPDRFVRMAATSLVVESGRHRHRVHHEIYPKPFTADYDIKREVGGLDATLRRVLFPSWWGNRPRPTWLYLRYWVNGTGNRTAGYIAACPAGKVSWAKDRLRETCGAVRFEIVGEVNRCAGEVARMPVSNDITWILGSSPRRHLGPLFSIATATPHADHPPDG